MTKVDLLLRNAGQLLTMGGPGGRIGLIEGGAVAARGGRISWVGRDVDVAAAVELEPGAVVIDAEGGVVMPGLVDPHTHLIFAGSRHQEFALRLAGKGYLEILAAGGGILSTVRATRAASLDELVEGARGRLARLLSFGVTTCEVKSGYGLELETELKMLEAARVLGQTQPVRIVPTLLAAHAVPEEHRARPEGYVELVCDEMIPEVARRGLAEQCDVFLDQGAFSRDQARRVLEAAKAAGLRPRLHAGQFTDQGGPELAAALGATSADHLEHLSDAGAAAMAAAGVVACLLPGAALTLGMRFPDAARLRAAGVEVALATDCNPGTSMTENLPLMVTLGATAMKLTIEDALRGVTCVAARALGLERELGALAPGLRADLVQLGVPDYRCLAYHFGVSHVRRVIAGGRVVLGA